MQHESYTRRGWRDDLQDDEWVVLIICALFILVLAAPMIAEVVMR